MLQGTDSVLCVSQGHRRPSGVRNICFQTALICLQIPHQHGCTALS